MDAAAASTVQTGAQKLLDLEDNLEWTHVRASFSYKQRAWVNAAEQLVGEQEGATASLQKLTLQLLSAIKPAVLPAWFRGALPRWKAAVSSAADAAAVCEAISILGAACHNEEAPAPEWAVKTEQQPPAMPEGVVVVKTEVKSEVKHEVPAWPADAVEVKQEVQVKQEVKQEPLAPVVTQGGAAGSSSGKTSMQAAPHVRRRPASPGEAGDEEPAAPGSKRARSSSGEGPAQPDSAGANAEASGAPGWQQEPMDEPDDEGGGEGWLPDPMGVDSDDEGGAGRMGEEDEVMTPPRAAKEDEEDEEDEDDEDDEEAEVSSEEDSDDGSAEVSETDSEEEDDGAISP